MLSCYLGWYVNLKNWWLYFTFNIILGIFHIIYLVFRLSGRIYQFTLYTEWHQQNKPRPSNQEPLNYSLAFLSLATLIKCFYFRFHVFPLHKNAVVTVCPAVNLGPENVIWRQSYYMYKSHVYNLHVFSFFVILEVWIHLPQKCLSCHIYGLIYPCSKCALCTFTAILKSDAKI